MVQASRVDARRRLEFARLYAITGDQDEAGLTQWAAACLAGGADVLQLRRKDMARGRLLEIARLMARLAHAQSALFIVNDHVDIAALSGADGVHLGADDLSIQGARAAGGPELLIGASASNPASARAAVASGADYLGSGPAFATPVKAAKAVIGPGGVAAVTAAVDRPVFAIGGIDGGNVMQLVEVGVRRVCVIRALGGPDAEEAARSLRQALIA